MSSFQKMTSIKKKNYSTTINFAKLKHEFPLPGWPVLPVFHQGEPRARFFEIMGMSNGYICLSPNNRLPQKDREDWTSFYNTAAEAWGVRCHGLATTGNRMMRISGLYSGDSTSWKTHGGTALASHSTISQPTASQSARSIP